MRRHILNTAMMRRRRAELGISARQLATMVGMTSPSYVAVENGGGNPDIGLDAAVRLAAALGVSLDYLVRTAPPAEDNDDVVGDAVDGENATGDDAAALGALLFTTGTLTPVGTLLEVLDRPLERLHAAETELAQRLQMVGLAIRRSISRLALVGDRTAISEGVLKGAVRRHIGRDHLSITEARMLRQVQYGDAPTQPSNPERVAMGVLVNAGLVDFGSSPSPTAEAPVILSEDVRFSLLLDDDQDDSAEPTRRRRSPATTSPAANVHRINESTGSVT
jgi:transcriptional regulator with XRE-family HTH domain